MVADPRRRLVRSPAMVLVISTADPFTPLDDSPGTRCHGALAPEAGEDRTLEALGNEGSDAGEAGRVTAWGVSVSVAVLAGSAGVVLLQPKSATDDKNSVAAMDGRMMSPVYL